MDETVPNVARIAMSPACVEEQEGKPTRTCGNPDAKEVDLGQDRKLEQGTPAAWGTCQTAELASTGVAESILVTDQHLETATINILRLLQVTQYKQQIQFNPLVQHTLLPRQPQHTAHQQFRNNTHTWRKHFRNGHSTRQSMFFTTPHFKTNSSQTTARAKIDTHAQAYRIPLSCF